MFHVITGNTADEMWLETASGVTNLRASCLQPSRAGDMHELGPTALTLNDPCQRWVISRQPALNPAFALAEVVWIITGRRDAQFLNYFNRQLPRYAGEDDEYHGAYGYRLRKHFGIDQLDRAFHTLRQKAESRQVVLQIWDASVDLPDSDGSPSAADIPCNIASLLKVRTGRLEWTQIMRSTDLFLGLPHNLVQFSSLQEIMAGWLGLDLGAFSIVTDSLHVYAHDLRTVQSSRGFAYVRNTDVLRLSRDESEKGFKTLASAVEAIVDPCVTEEQLLRMMMGTILPDAYLNILRMLVAEGLRRRRCLRSADRVVADCSNRLFTQLWSNWKKRVGSRTTSA